MTKIAIGESVIYQTLQDEVVVLNMSTQKYFALDDVGASMWKMLLKHCAVEPAARELESVYEVDGATLRQDLETLLKHLVSEGLLKISQN